MNVWVNGWKGGWRDRWVGELMCEWVDGQGVGRQMYGWNGRWMGGCIKEFQRDPQVLRASRFTDTVKCWVSLSDCGKSCLAITNPNASG